MTHRSQCPSSHVGFAKVKPPPAAPDGWQKVPLACRPTGECKPREAMVPSIDTRVAA